MTNNINKFDEAMKKMDTQFHIYSDTCDFAVEKANKCRKNGDEIGAKMWADFAQIHLNMMKKMVGMQTTALIRAFMEES